MAAEGKDLLRRLAFAWILLFAFAGCGSESRPTDNDAADTARFELVITRTDKEGRLLLSGSYDYVKKQGSMTATLLGTEAADTDVPTEVRFFGDRYYTPNEHEGKRYWVVDTEEASAYPNEAIVPFPESGLDAKRAVDVILASAAEVEKLGESEVRGASTTHSRVVLDPEALAKNLPPGRRLAGGDPSQETPFAVEIWSDEAGRLRRIVIREEMGEEHLGTLAYEFFDFGLPVDVERPPAGQVVTHDEFDRMTELTDEEMLELCKEELPKEECERMSTEGK